jgi:DNA invertase Pin-like site-specific DNA recombinase
LRQGDMLPALWTEYMAVIGYIRSTKDADLKSQQELIKAANCEKIYSDKAGLRDARPEWDKLLEYIRPGDTVVATELTRMIRSYSHLSKLARDFETRGINLVSLQDGINTSDTGRCFFNMAKAISKLEKNFKEELKALEKDSIKARGRKGGRPNLPQDILKNAADLFRSGGKTADEVAKLYNIGRRTLFNYLKAQEQVEKEVEQSKPD